MSTNQQQYAEVIAMLIIIIIIIIISIIINQNVHIYRYMTYTGMFTTQVGVLDTK
jgi:hypothetical protein